MEQGSIPHLTNRLELKNITITYSHSEDQMASRLIHLDLSIDPGEWLYVVGVNGSGKSTLGRIVAGLYPDGTKGQVERGFAGEGSTPIVLQQPSAQLFGETPREEITFALEWKGLAVDEIPALVEQALANIGLTALGDEPWERLSGGQQQLAAIAAATTGYTPMIVLDEVTSMLDETNRGTIIKIARELHRKGTAIIWITQRLDELERDSRVVAVAEGTIVYDGLTQPFLQGEAGERSPCERSGLFLPYMTAFERSLRDQGYTWHPNSASLVKELPSLACKESLPTLRLQPGTITLLLGPNGIGKTTWLEKLAGLRASEGLQIRYGPIPLWRRTKLRGKRLNEEALLQYSYACQAPEESLFARSVKEELDYSLRPYSLNEEERRSRYQLALTAVGWDSAWLERDPYLMSGGERRRAALASVFVAPASWLLLDEPTAGLDGAGHTLVAQHLEWRKSEGTGILLVSHDTDWAIPLADQILLMSKDKTIRQCKREELLEHPEWMEHIGMTVPNWLACAHRLWRKGIAANQLWKPELAAMAFIQWGIEANKPPLNDGITRDQKQLEAKLHTKGLQLEVEAVDAAVKENYLALKHRLSGFDPRSVWLAYLLLSTGLFFLTDWLSAALGGGLVAALLIAGRVSLRRWRGLIYNYIFFSVLTSAIFALGAASGSDSMMSESFSNTLFIFVRTMLVLLLGLAIPLVMTPLQLRRSLTQMLSIKGRTRKGVHSFLLTVALMMRFIPVLLSLWERFNRIFLARGKSLSRTPGAMMRRLRDVTMPFLFSLFRLGEEVTLALESRGIGPHVKPTPSIHLKWRLRDYILAAGAAGLGFILWLTANR